MSNGEMNGGKCRIGVNGCVTVQSIKVQLAEGQVKIKSNEDDIVDLKKCVDEIKSLLLKAVIGLGLLTGFIQLFMKYIDL